MRRTELDSAKVLKLYQAGVTAQDIARRFGVGRTPVVKALRAEGLGRLKRGVRTDAPVVAVMGGDGIRHTSWIMGLDWDGGI